MYLSHLSKCYPSNHTYLFFHTGGSYWLGDGHTYLWSPVLGKSWFEWTFENSLPPWITLSNCPNASNLWAVLKPLSKVSKIWTWFPSSEIIKRVGQVLPFHYPYPQFSLVETYFSAFDNGVDEALLAETT